MQDMEVPRVAVSVDLVILTVRASQLSLRCGDDTPSRIWVAGLFQAASSGWTRTCLPPRAECWPSGPDCLRHRFILSSCKPTATRTAIRGRG